MRIIFKIGINNLHRIIIFIIVLLFAPLVFYKSLMAYGPCDVKCCDVEPNGKMSCGPCCSDNTKDYCNSPSAKGCDDTIGPGGIGGLYMDVRFRFDVNNNGYIDDTDSYVEWNRLCSIPHNTCCGIANSYPAEGGIYVFSSTENSNPFPSTPFIYSVSEVTVNSINYYLIKGYNLGGSGQAVTLNMPVYYETNSRTSSGIYNGVVEKEVDDVIYLPKTFTWRYWDRPYKIDVNGVSANVPGVGSYGPNQYPNDCDSGKHPQFQTVLGDGSYYYGIKVPSNLNIIRTEAYPMWGIDVSHFGCYVDFTSLDYQSNHYWVMKCIYDASLVDHYPAEIGQLHVLLTDQVPYVAPSCTIANTFPPSIQTGFPTQMTSNITVSPVGFTPDHVTYTSSPALNINPIDSSVSGDASPFSSSTSITADSLGEYTVESKVYITDTNSVIAERCSKETPFSVVYSNPWWQVVDADVWTSGMISSNLPPDTYFDLLGDGGTPGVPVYNTTANISNQWISEKNWLAKSDSFFKSTINQYTYSYFYRKVPQTIQEDWENGYGIDDGEINADQLTSSSLCLAGSGGCWLKSEGDLQISGDADLGGIKVIVFVEGGNLTINGNIDFTEGSGLFMAVVGKSSPTSDDGNISIEPVVTNVKGVFVADNTFNTGEGENLSITGSVTAWNGVELLRNPASNSSPAEHFTYSPQMLLSIPFTLKKINWREVVP